ncbi:MAG: hypothetical protein LBU37_09210, partial [Tannerellaceae bacterium]|nr:hypothetical protein [Tannerellaceae bacterium]
FLNKTSKVAQQYNRAVMNRIATTGLNNSDNLLLSKMLSITTGYDLIVGQSYSPVAHQYGLKADINLCQWPEGKFPC